MVGRPPVPYNPDIAAELCGRVLSSRDSLRTICAEMTGEGTVIAESTVFRWLSQNEEFQELYTRAKQLQCHAIAEGLRDMAADGTNDYMLRLAYNGGNPGWELNGENINRSKLRIDTDKWLLSKLMPKKYGDTQQVEMSANVKIDRNITVTYVNPPALQGPRHPPTTYQPAIEEEAVEVEDEEFIDDWENND